MQTRDRHRRNRHAVAPYADHRAAGSLRQRLYTAGGTGRAERADQYQPEREDRARDLYPRGQAARLDHQPRQRTVLRTTMKANLKLTSLLLALLLALPAAAMTLNEAMSALGEAKASGVLGEKPDGYLGVVRSSQNAEDIASQINQARRAEYHRVAKQNGISVSDVEAIAGKKAIEKTPPGQIIQLNGNWVRK
ncbi:uncharacterized protein conserved in bacteria [Stutzerimonas stutzeri A1501]|uniref:Uncharacterized protein conserved in bacteria n=2 Tax=Stutzerimonas stutzeri TaxID=316 RepID=A4VN81_STUS1|nr:uncharacterized protein conserved in bacteria [Stutzerimonas stutzeri A1501]